jgi:hypothetical protein
MLERARAALLDHLPKEAIISAFLAAGGAEVGSGKLWSENSSAALAANAFGFFVGGEEAAKRLVWPTRLADLGHATAVRLEAKMAFPWRGGSHPWLDAAVEEPGALIGIESKRFEPFRDAKAAEFSEAYDRKVWGDAMAPFETMRDRLRVEPGAFVHLDACQLVKHAFGLRTQAHKSRRRATLVYLYAEPATLWNAQPLTPKMAEAHRTEIEAFGDAVRGAEVSFEALSYHELLAAWKSSGDLGLAGHARLVAGRFRL